jgi:hypothetical protein
MDYTPDAIHIAKWQWDLIHDPGVILRVFERDADAMNKQIKDFVVYYDNFECNRQDTLYFLNGLNKIINLQTKKQENEQWKSVKVDWIIKEKEYKDIDTVAIKIQDGNFDVITKRKNYISRLSIQFLDIDIKQEIISTLQELLDIEKTFNNIVDSIDKEIIKSKFDAFLFKGKNNAYVNKGMHKLIDTSDYAATENRLFSLMCQLYEMDFIIAKHEGKFDNMIDNINKVMSKDEKGNIYIDPVFRETVTSQIEEIQNISKEEIMRWYKSSIKTIIIKIISSDE